jgi:serine O-acetyltransferase
MIQSKEDYLFYLEADRIGLMMENRRRPRLMGDEVWKFQRALRRCEYIRNCKKGLIRKLLWAFASFRYRRLAAITELQVPINVCGPGLSIAHRGFLIIDKDVRIGENCRLQNLTHIGSANQRPGYPKIGNNVYIGACCNIYGDITIADGIAIGANSVVNKSFTEPNTGIAGAPAKKINDVGSKYNFIDATGIARASGKFPGK